MGLTSRGLKILDDAGMPNTVVPGNHDFDNATGSSAEFNTCSRPSRYSRRTWNAEHGQLRRLPGPEPVRPRPGRPRQHGQLRPVHRRRARLPGAEPRVGGAAATPWTGREGARRLPRPHRHHGHPQLRDHRRQPRDRSPNAPAAPADLDVERLRRHSSARSGWCSAATTTTATWARRTAPTCNTCGQPVQQILTDYQDRANGGDGWLRYYTFDPAANTMTATTYSPKLGTSSKRTRIRPSPCRST